MAIKGKKAVAKVKKVGVKRVAAKKTVATVKKTRKVAKPVAKKMGTAVKKKAVTMKKVGKTKAAVKKAPVKKAAVKKAAVKKTAAKVVKAVKAKVAKKAKAAKKTKKAAKAKKSGAKAKAKAKPGASAKKKADRPIAATATVARKALVKPKLVTGQRTAKAPGKNRQKPISALAQTRVGVSEQPPSFQAKVKKLRIVAKKMKKGLNTVEQSQPAQVAASPVGTIEYGAFGMIAPYSVEPGEDYMNEKQCQHFRNLLEHWKQGLMEEVDRTVHHMQDEAANFPDLSDRATQEEEFSLELRTRDRERKLIKKIEEALHKLDNNDYGYCEECGVAIGIKRLEARPTATLCIDCKTLNEIKEKQTVA